MANQYLPQLSPEQVNRVSAGNRVRHPKRPLGPLATLAGAVVLTALAAATTPAQQGGNTRPSSVTSTLKGPNHNQGNGQFELVVLDNGKPFTGSYATIWDDDIAAPTYYSGISESGAVPVPSGLHSLVIGRALTIGNVTPSEYPSDIEFASPPKEIEFNIRVGSLTVLFVDVASFTATGPIWPPGGFREVYRPEINYPS